MNIIIQKSLTFRGDIQVPGDKSIGHRALMFGALADGESHITGLPEGRDVLSTASCLSALGVRIVNTHDETIVQSKGLRGFTSPGEALNCGNSGTTARLLLGMVAGAPAMARFTGDASLSRRPMARVTAPLKTMGAGIFGRQDAQFLPLEVHGRQLRGITYPMVVNSAQVKSAILLAGLSAEGVTEILVPGTSRDHTERFFALTGVKVEKNHESIRIVGGQKVQPFRVHVPGDISSASYFLAAAAILRDGEIRVRDVGLNPTRTGFVSILRLMGADLDAGSNGEFEPYGTVSAKSGKRLRGVEIPEEMAVNAIDELPLVALVATQAVGTTTITGAAELRVKESDRISAIVEGLSRMGAKISSLPDGFVVSGPTPLHGAEVRSHHDHRIAMMLTVAGLLAEGRTTIEDAECASISYPGFYADMRALCDKGSIEESNDVVW